MQSEKFIYIFNNSISFLSEDWKGVYGHIANQEHWSLLGNRIYSFVFENSFQHYNQPIFEEEIIQDLSMHYHSFEVLKTISEITAPFIAKVIETTSIESLLVVLGQRKTSATITDEGGIPPTRRQLIESCFTPFNEQISKASRAREKHISRNNENGFWGDLKGGPNQKEQATKILVESMIAEQTWWNVFTHYKHGDVFEIRVSSGEGIRWRKDNLELIGFLEPFI